MQKNTYITTNSSHQTNRNIPLHSGIEIYLDFQVQLNVDLQARIAILLGWAVDNPALSDGRNALATRGRRRRLSFENLDLL